MSLSGCVSEEEEEDMCEPVGHIPAINSVEGERRIAAWDPQHTAWRPVSAPYRIQLRFFQMDLNKHGHHVALPPFTLCER